MIPRLLIIALASVVATALESTYLLTWSSSMLASFNSLPTNIDSNKLVNHISHSDELCKFEAVIFIQPPGVHLSSSHLTRSISSATSARSFKVFGSLDLIPTAETLSSHCNARLLNYPLVPSSSGHASLEKGETHVFSIQTLHIHPESDLEKHNSAIAAELATITAAFSSYIVIYAGPILPDLKSRQASDVFEHKSPQAFQSAGFFTTGLVTSLLITFFILFPALMMGIGALASIQTSTLTGCPKGYSAFEKKNQ